MAPKRCQLDERWRPYWHVISHIVVCSSIAMTTSLNPEVQNRVWSLVRNVNQVKKTGWFSKSFLSLRLICCPEVDLFSSCAFLYIEAYYLSTKLDNIFSVHQRKSLWLVPLSIISHNPFSSELLLSIIFSISHSDVMLINRKQCQSELITVHSTKTTHQIMPNRQLYIGELDFEVCPGKSAS